MRKVAKPKVLTEGEITYLSNSAGFLVLQTSFSPSVGFADSSPIRWSQGTSVLYHVNISFDALNLWASKRGLEVSNNRIGTKNACRLNLWRQAFVFYNTAVAGSRHSRHAGSRHSRHYLFLGAGDGIMHNGLEKWFGV